MKFYTLITDFIGQTKKENNLNFQRYTRCRSELAVKPRFGSTQLDGSVLTLSTEGAILGRKLPPFIFNVLGFPACSSTSHLTLNKPQRLLRVAEIALQNFVRVPCHDSKRCDKL